MLWPWRHTLEQQRIKWTSPGAYLRSEKRKRWEREYAAAQEAQWRHDRLMRIGCQLDPGGREWLRSVTDEVEFERVTKAVEADCIAYARYYNDLPTV